MSSYRVEELLASLKTGMALTAGDDALLSAMEEALQIIRGRPWPWNWKEDVAFITYAPFTPEDTFTWVLGETKLTMATGGTLPRRMTGRKVKIGDYWYRVIAIEHPSGPNEVNLDRPLMSDNADGVALTFVRDEISLPTTSIRTVEVNRRKIDKFTPDFRTRKPVGLVFERDVGRPTAYIPYDSIKIPAPKLPPYAVKSAGGGTNPEAGTYFYFTTHYDQESGLESAPGPMIKYVHDGSKWIDVTYGMGSELTTYQLRLYRSKVNPKRGSRCPMYLIDAHDVSITAAYVDKNIAVNMWTLPQYWDGPYSTISLYPKPDSERVTVSVTYLDNYFYRLDPEDQIEMGVDSQVMELLRIHLAGVIGLATRNPEEYRKAIIQFRGQLDYLITKARESGAADPGPENKKLLIPGDTSEYGADWVDVLPSSVDY